MLTLSLLCPLSPRSCFPWSQDQGGVVPAIALYKHALKACDLDAKGRGSVLLSLVHTMEVEYQYNEAFALIKQHLRENADTKAGSLRLGDFYGTVLTATARVSGLGIH